MDTPLFATDAALVLAAAGGLIATLIAILTDTRNRRRAPSF